MRRRLTVAMALMHDPKLLFLDEPISGLDVQSTRYIKALVHDLNKSGVTIFLTTHQIEVASELCDRVAIINQGNIATIGTPADLKANIESVQTIAVTFDAPDDTNIPSLAELPGVNHELKAKSGNERRLYTDNPADVIPAIVDFAREHKLRINSMNTLGDYIRTVVNAWLPHEKRIKGVMECFPYHCGTRDREIDQEDYSLSNIRRVERIVNDLKYSKERISTRLQDINKELETYEDILNDLLNKREANIKTIPIVDDDEYENF